MPDETSVPNILTVFSGVSLTGLVVGAWSLFRFVGASSEAVRIELNTRVNGVDSRITDLGTTHDIRVREQTESLRREIEKAARAVADTESKARHALAEDTQRSLSRLESEIKSMRMECFRATDGQRLEMKVDKLSDAISRQPVLEESLKALRDSLDRLSRGNEKRLEMS